MAYTRIDHYDEITTTGLSKSYKDIIAHLGEDVNREGLDKTPERVARAMQYLTQGYQQDAVSILNSAKFHEAATHVIRTDHLMSSAHITVNDKTFSALAADSQKLLTDCAREAVQNTRTIAQNETNDVVRKMAAEGAKVSNIDKAPIQQRAKDGVTTMESGGAWSSGLWEQIQKL